MKRKLLLGIGCLWALSVAAQLDPVLMRINGIAVPRSEFESAYQKSRTLQGTKPQTPGEYVGTFVDFKLKIAAGQAAGIDTTRAFREELTRHRAQLAQSYLTDTLAETTAVRQVYERMKGTSQADRLLVMHLFFSLPQTVSATRLRAAEARMDSIYNVLTLHPEADFQDFVEKYSDEKELFWVGRLRMPEEFEKVVFSLEISEISKPFLTPQGVHMVQLVDREEAPSFEEMREVIDRRLTRQQTINPGTVALVQKLKAENHYTPHQAGIEELLMKGATNHLLFTLNGQQYTGADFQRFAASYPRGTQKQFDAFVTKTVLDDEYAHLEQKYPLFNLSMQQHAEQMLLDEITRREVGEKAATDETGLATYFKLHQSDYHWTPPRFRGTVLHCADEKIARQAKKLLKKRSKKMSDTELYSAILETFNTPSAENVLVEQGVFTEGTHAGVDKLIFKKGDFEPSKSHPFIVVWGEKWKGPDSYKEVGESLVVDYRNFLDALWAKRLRAVAKVEINQEVLKTVNNH